VAVKTVDKNKVDWYCKQVSHYYYMYYYEYF